VSNKVMEIIFFSESCFKLSLRSRSLFLQLRVQIAVDDGAIVVVVAIKGP